ncbi:DUF4224 domain-containing protein [Achromobacter sp. SD115]|uniref:DUF4224 domain-containing protein n=1 Tax=unclassified Achromobacter TaxID=2626865 RepID=UPI001A977A20|nr:DUF4224 domain-containing protein [Achromobacter sp. SD115]MBO1013456.1 DUF4224 domain-containing protein [Achromobacter sp. SD115]
MKPYLSDAEIDEICEPLTQPHAQIRYLQRLGVPVSRKPGGRPLVGRAAFDRVMAGSPPEAANDAHPPPSGPQPDHAALQQLFNKQRKHGTQAKIG